MNILKLVVIFSVSAFLLNGCGSGKSNISLAPQQTFSVQASSGGNGFGLSGTASGCQNIVAKGNCGVSITYTGTGLYAGPLTISGLSGYNSTIANCSSASATSVQCSFTITNTNAFVISTPESAVFSFNGNVIESSGLFIVGGGL